MSKSKGYTHKITSIKPNQFIKILKLFGFKSKSFNGGSHVKMTKKSIKRPIVVVKHGNQEIRSFDIKSSLKTAGISEQDYLDKFNSL